MVFSPNPRAGFFFDRKALLEPEPETHVPEGLDVKPPTAIAAHARLGVCLLHGGIYSCFYRVAQSSSITFLSCTVTPAIYFSKTPGVA